MTRAQEATMKSAAAAAGRPIKVNASTARVLGEQYGYIQRCGEGWILTKRGRDVLAYDESRERYGAVDRALSAEGRSWAERVVAWMFAHDRLRGRRYEAEPRYAEHVAAADFDGVTPAAAVRWDEDAMEDLRERVRGAADCLKGYDEAMEKARARGVGVIVDYQPGTAPRRSRREATEAARGPEGAVDLTTYRERRNGR